MTGSAGPSLVAASVAGLAVAVVGESAFQLATYASYAREDARSPLRASVVGTIVSLLCLPIALSLHDDDAVLLAVGLSFSLGSAVAAIGLHRRLRRLLPASRYESTRSLLKTLAASLVMLLPASAACSVISGALSEPAGVIVGLAVAAVLGVATFVGLQALLRSPELAYFLTGLRRTSTGGP
jgi:peptidoglycan biosynthesis protein MviN/MurJ (putative lipid II flippase)